MNITQVTGQDYFGGLMENRPSKICSVVFSQLGNCIALLSIYSIIWYEKFGTTEYKTVINRLNVQCWWTSFVYYGFFQQLEIVRYIFGPMPWALCQLNIFAKLFAPMYLVLLLDFIIITRYLFIFWIKNPVGLNDEMLGTFFTLWSLLFTFISQSVLIMMPGKEFPDIWFCSGLDPNSSLEQGDISIFGYNIFKLLSLVLHIAIGVRIKLYKWKVQKENNKYDPRSKVTWLFHMGKNSIISISESLIPGIIVTVAILPKPPRQELVLDTFNHYPECLHEYYFTLIRPVLVALVVLISKITSDKYLQKVMFREFKDIVDKFASKK